jgi:hypothetical protein
MSSTSPTDTAATGNRNRATAVLWVSRYDRAAPDGRGRGRRARSRQEQADRRGLEECPGRSGRGLRVRAGDEPALLPRPRPDPCARGLLVRCWADPGPDTRAGARQAAARLVGRVRGGPSRGRHPRLTPLLHDRPRANRRFDDARLRAINSDYQAPDHLTIEYLAPTRSSITDEQRQLILLVEVTPGR